PAALTTGVAAADGSQMALADDDTVWEPPHVGSVLRGVAESRADVAYTGVRRLRLTPEGAILQDDRLLEPFDRSKLLRGNYIYSSATVFRKSTWRDVGGYDERFPVYEDWEFLLRATDGRLVIALPVWSAVTRNFTGHALLPEHFITEPADCRRCMAAVYWKYRSRGTNVIREHYTPRQAARLIAAWWWHGQL